MKKPKFKKNPLMYTLIQENGILFLVDYESFDLLQVSENVSEALGMDAAYPIVIVIILTTILSFSTIFNLF
jgi:hypothetical protein